MKDLISVVEQAISGVKQTADNGEMIEESMQKVLEMADKVEQLIQKTNNILS